MSHDGDLSLWYRTEKVWSAGTRGIFAVMQSDGNFVVRHSSRWPVWSSGTRNNDGSSLRIRNNGVVEIIDRVGNRIWKTRPYSLESSKNVGPAIESGLREDIGITCEDQKIGKLRLHIGQFICSPNGMYRFGIDRDGDLSLWETEEKIWSANTYCEEGKANLKLQADGNLIVCTKPRVACWRSKTNGNPGASLLLSDGGIAAILNRRGQVVWSTGETMFEEDKLALNRIQDSLAPESNDNEKDEYSCIEQVQGKLQLQQGEFICSPNGIFRFGIASDGDLSLWAENDNIWSAGTDFGETNARMQVGGNLIVRSNSGKVLWASHTPNNRGASLVLRNNGVVAIESVNKSKIWIVNGDNDSSPAPSPYNPTPFPSNGSTCMNQVEGKIYFSPGNFICSPDGNSRFGLTADGDLALLAGSVLIWSAGTAGEGAYAKLQLGGSMVVKSKNRNVSWSSRTGGNPGSSLVLGDNGIVDILTKDGLSIWTSATAFDDRSVKSLVPTSSPITIYPTPIPTGFLPSAQPFVIRLSSSPTSIRGCINPDTGNDIFPGQFVCSTSKRYRFGLDNDGDLSLWDHDNKKWSAESGSPNLDISAKLRDDGTLIVRSVDSVLWSSNSDGNGNTGSFIEVHDDGVATITTPDGFYVWSSAAANGMLVDTSTLEKKVMAGYQGWFMTSSDGGLNRWQHWSHSRTTPSKNTITIDMWPDMSEYDADELTPTDFEYSNGSNAGLYSAYNAKTVDRHVKWLQDYDISGLFVQRFIGNAVARPHIRDKVTHNVRLASEKYGRVFVNMYDISNGQQSTLVNDLKNDWMHLIDEEQITRSKSYLHHRGKPIVAIWGFGFHDRIGTPSQAIELIDWFQNNLEPRYRATVMGGVPAGWRTLTRDSRTNSAWASIYRSFDVISPWTVGRMVDAASVDYFTKNYIVPDLAECESLGIDYLPVAFPGFSSHALKPGKPFNEIPRLGGNFLWRQYRNIIRAGSQMIYVAMYDETDEGTAIFKVAENQDQVPTKGKFLTLDGDLGYNKVPSDWYLQLTGEVSRILENGGGIADTIPQLSSN